MTVVSALSPISLTQFFYQSGKIVRPARLFFYAPSTEDRVTVYSDAALGTPYDQPVLSGGSGRVPPIYVGEEPYRVRIFDSYGALIEDIDWLPGAVAPTTGGGSGTTPPEKLIQTGDYIIQFANGGARTGFVRANGGLIGPTGFTGVGFTDIERQNDDTYALFKHLWGQDTGGALQVVPSKGPDADSDWFSLAKMIRLPDLCGRAVRGIDGMGMAAKGRLIGVLITPTGPDGPFLPGATGGTATATMTTAQMPVHAHSINSVGTGVTVAGAATGITIATGYANIAGAYTGVYVSDPGHSHRYNAFRAGRPGGIQGVTSTGDSAYVDTMTDAAVTGVSIVDPTHTHSDYGHVHGVSDPWHVHGVNDPTHTHSIGSTGSGAALPTTGPFSLATFYIKL
jgi:hypothetical protein